MQKCAIVLALCLKEDNFEYNFDGIMKNVRFASVVSFLKRFLVKKGYYGNEGLGFGLESYEGCAVAQKR